MADRLNAPTVQEQRTRAGRVEPALLPSRDPMQPWPSDLPAFEAEGERFVQPRYDGLGLANLGPTILRQLLGRDPGLSLPPLAPAALPPALTQGVQAVVLLVADGLGHLQLVREMARGNAPTFTRLLQAAERSDEGIHYATLTSVFPTTTVAALGSLSTAVVPAEHGLLGYTALLEEPAGVAELIRWGPVERRGSFADADLGGHSPEAFLWSPTIHQHLASAGIERSFAVNPRAFADTPLTRMLHQGARQQGYVAPSALAAIVPRLLRDEASGPLYIFAYWSTVDSVTHVLGPDSDEHAEEVAVADHLLGRLLARLPDRGDTLLLFTADHGHVGTSVSEQVLLNQYPDLLALLRAYPAGERRATYLYAQPGQQERVEAYARERLGEVAVVVSRHEAERRGLFGPVPLSPRASARIGDVLLLPRRNLQLYFQPPVEHVPRPLRLPEPPAFQGLHGGLSPEETLVPLLAIRC